MFVCRRSKHGYHWNQLYFNRFLITIIILVTTLYRNKIVHADSLRITLDETNCTAYKTCTQCINSTLECTWFVRKQMCHDSVTDSNSTENLVVTDVSFCPKFSVKFPRVTITNDQGRLIDLLKNHNVLCQLEGKNYTALVDNNEIVCNGVTSNLSNSTNIEYLSIAFNDTQLQFDNVLNHYVYPSDARYYQKDSCLQCSWDDDRYRYYCIMCPPNNQKCMRSNTYQHCDVRTLTNFTHVHLKNLSISDECPMARIKLFQPEYGCRTSITSVQISVNPVLLQRSISLFVVYVAGRKCSSHTSFQTKGTIMCNVSPNSDVKLVNSGPVEVTFIGETNLTIRSNKMFEFGDPVINSIQPTYGPVTNTLLNIYGNFFYNSTKVRAFVGDDLECKIITLNRTRVQCTITSPSNYVNAASMSCHDVRLEFGGGQQIKYSPGFQYVADPMVDAGQTFNGIASGNTTLRVRGQRFSYLQNPIVRVHNNDSHCEKRNDTYMECRLPALNANLSNQPLKLWFLGDFAQKKINITDNYTLYPNPIFTDFTIDHCCNITVKGQNLDHGYRVKDDLSIRLVDKNSSECWVIAVDSHQITCWISSNSSNMQLQQIIVKIGYNVFKVKVAKKRTSHYSKSSLTSIILPSVITITMYIAFITCLCIALLFLKTSTKQYDLMNNYLRQQLLEMRPLNEHQKNSVYDDDDDDNDYGNNKSKNMA